MTERDGLFEGIFATAIDGIIAITEEGIVESFNPAAEKLLGYTSDEVVGKNVRMLMPSPDREAHDGYIGNYLSTGQRKIIGSGREVKALHKSGVLIPIHLSLSEAQVGSRRVFVGLCRDIRELVRVRSEVEAVRLRNEAVLDTAADGILTIDAVGIIQSFNGAAEKLFGFTRPEVLGQNVKRLMPSTVAVHHDEYLAHTLLTGERHIIGIGREVRAQRKDGSTFPAWLSVSQFEVDGEQYFTGILRDISALREKEDALRVANAELEETTWLAKHQLELNQVLREAPTLISACQALVDALSRQTGAIAAVGYLSEDSDPKLLRLVARNSAPAADLLPARIRAGEGLLGQAVQDREVRLVDVVTKQFSIASSFGTVVPAALALIPLLHNEEVVGALELAYQAPPERRVLRYLRTSPSAVAAILGTLRDSQRIQRLLAQSQAQMEELQVANEQLDQRAQELQAQQQEMETTNELLAEQKARLEMTNTDLERSQREVEEKAEALQKAGRYKSEFLANMSHELRTPLNSILVLAKVLAENRSGSLEQDQVDSLRVIAGSGEDLLNLINDILDLSKIEAGKLRFAPHEVVLSDILENLRQTFAPIIAARGLHFDCVFAADLPGTLYTDGQRLQQILRNLLSNANKFTEHGAITLRVSNLTPEFPTKRPDVMPGDALLFEVSDTGVGVPADKHELIFQAFQQADNTLSRRFGGTGLGLSISSSLAEQLGGEIHLKSEEGKGSTFTLVVPVRYDFGTQAEPNPTPPSPIRESVAPGPAITAVKGPDTLLLVEDDKTTQLALSKLLSTRALTVVTASSPGEALERCREQTFRCIILDLKLAGGSGFELLRALETLPGETPPIIVHTGKDLTPEEEAQLQGHSHAIVIKGARASERLVDELRLLLHSSKPRLATKPIRHRDELFANKRVLVVDDDVRNVFALRALLGSTGMKIETAESGKTALSKFEREAPFDCILMDIMMPEMDGYETIRRIRARSEGVDVPIIALTAKAMMGDRKLCLDAGANDYLSKPIRNDELLGLMRVWMSR